MPTINDIIAKVNTYFVTGGNILAVEDNEVLLDILGKLGGHVIISHIYTHNPVVFSTLKQGTVVDGHTMAEGDTIALGGQTDPAENGIYLVGLNDGDTDFHPDWPDAASAANKMLILENADLEGNTMLITSLDGSGNFRASTALQASGTASGTDSTSGDSKAITFAQELTAAPTKIKLWVWDAKGRAVSCGYDPATLATTGFTVNVPGNAEAVQIIYEASI